MSWFARSLANSLRLDDISDDDYSENDVPSDSPHDLSPVKRNEEDNTQSSSRRREIEEEEEEEAQARGVKEDLTELKQTLTRQLWGVASFLAPPPPSNGQSVCDNLNNNNQSEPSEGEESTRIDQDFVEIGGRFISKMDSNYFPIGSEEESDTEEYEEAIGITDEVLAFARNIAMHPETWLDFPLDEEDDLDDFDMSDAQREHALAVEQLAPRLAALRIELCPCHMTESYFWKVYFVLLHSRLNKHDADILSTPQVMEARAMWMQELHKQTKLENEWYGRCTTYENDRDNNVLHDDFGYARTFDFEPTTSRATDYETEKHPVVSTDMQFIDKSVIEEKPVIKLENKDLLSGRPSKLPIPNYEDEEDDWPDEEDSDLGSYKATFPLGNEEDFSFSDLEDDTNSTIPMRSKMLSESTETSTS